MQSYVHASRDRSVEEILTELAVERTRLLRGVKPGYGPPPPYESVYTDPSSHQGMEALSEIQAAYTRAGATLPDATHDQPDFIGFELDFMRHLTEWEALARAQDDEKEVMRAVRVQRDFLSDHLDRWVPRFCAVMFEQAQLDFYRGVALVTRGLVRGEADTAAERGDQVCGVTAA